MLARKREPCLRRESVDGPAGGSGADAVEGVECLAQCACGAVTAAGSKELLRQRQPTSGCFDGRPHLVPRLSGSQPGLWIILAVVAAQDRVQVSEPGVVERAMAQDVLGGVADRR